MNLQLKNKYVLVTGSSRGIGLEIAKGFLRENALVTISSNNYKELQQAKSNLINDFSESRISSFKCDFTSQQETKKLTNNFKKLNILIVNVGGGTSVPDTIPKKDHFDSVFNLNFTTAINTTREFLPLIKKSRGNIIFIASIAGIEAFGAPTDYSVAKSAVIAFSKNIARKIAREGVRVNCIAPGNIYFQGGTWHKKIRQNPHKIKTLINDTVPMNRFGTPDEVADACLFISSERAKFITGALLCIDGGQTVSFC